MRDVMQHDVVCVAPDTALEEVERLLLKHHISSMPVVVNRRVIGVVTRSDVVRQLLIAQSRAFGVLHDHRRHARHATRSAVNKAASQGAEVAASQLADLRVADAMTQDVVVISPSDSVKAAAARMVRRGTHRLFVIDGGELAGVLTSLDLLSLLADDRATLRPPPRS